MINSVFIDLDNTLIDSNQIHEICFKRVLEKIKSDFDFNYENYKGISTLDVFSQLGLDKSDALIAAELKSRMYQTYILEKRIDFFPSVNESLLKLSDLNFEIFLCTAGSKTSVELILSTLPWQINFDEVFCSSDSLFRKSDDKYWLDILIRVDKHPSEVIVVDDSPSVIDAAFKSGISNLALVNCRVNKDPSLIINNLSDIFSKFGLS